MTVLYKNILNLCNKKKIKPSDLAKQIGVSKSTLSNWNDGRSKPSDVNMVSLANFFGVDIDYFNVDHSCENEVQKEKTQQDNSAEPKVEDMLLRIENIENSLKQEKPVKNDGLNKVDYVMQLASQMDQSQILETVQKLLALVTSK